MLDFEHVFRCSQFSHCLSAQLTLFALAFFFVCATFSSVRPIFCPRVDSIFCSSWDDSSANLWILPTFSDPQNMNRDDLTFPVAAAATSQVKLCPYDEEEPHIWFRLIEAQFAAAEIKSQKLKYANTLASLPKQVLWDILDTIDVCNSWPLLLPAEARAWGEPCGHLATPQLTV